ncbi:hypothetical protein C1645_819787 [Glomus cerebriforme]|uniref:Uncharacterized protein n=1 Tax=Glomus cerebriforme TaxID=658196 RepID=A0A397TE36_9GLOM|nr:hypothetical protein C1645_819787 [Glomus cerebriforme]
MNAIKKIALDENTNLAIIPDGLTSIIQLLDILKTWAEILKEMIVKSFKKYGISNVMDRSEDDLFGQNEKKGD